LSSVRLLYATMNQLYFLNFYVNGESVTHLKLPNKDCRIAKNTFRNI
jgi:hypothetical protein